MLFITTTNTKSLTNAKDLEERQMLVDLYLELVVLVEEWLSFGSSKSGCPLRGNHNYVRDEPVQLVLTTWEDTRWN